jgi:hypothetical protein
MAFDTTFSDSIVYDKPSEPNGFSWWDHDVVDGKIIKTEPAVKRELPEVTWDEEDIVQPISISVPSTENIIENIIENITENITENISKDEPEDSDISESESDDETIAKTDGKKKSSKQNDYEKFKKLLEKLVPLITKHKSMIETQVFAIGRQGYVGQNLSNHEYNIPGYGYILIFLKKAESYYHKQGTPKINISKLRNDIDITKTNLRLAIFKQDTQLQQKLCDKMVEQKKILEDALESISNIKKKNTPLDYVKSALRIIKRGNERSIRFVQMFREMVAPLEQHVVVPDVSTVETKTVSVKKEEKKSSIFAKKTLVL